MAIKQLTWPLLSRKCSRQLAPGTALRKETLILFLAEVSHVYPIMRHFINRAIAPTYPLIRVRVVGIVGSIVMPCRSDDHGALGYDRSGIFFVHIVDLPVPLEIVYEREHLSLTVGINRFHGHGLAAHVHMGLEVLDTSGG